MPLPPRSNIDKHLEAHQRFALHEDVWVSLWRLSKAVAHLAIQFQDAALYQLALRDMLAIVKYGKEVPSLEDARTRLYDSERWPPRTWDEVTSVQEAHFWIYDDLERRTDRARYLAARQR